jgi:hypothetical protein
MQTLNTNELKNTDNLTYFDECQSSLGESHLDFAGQTYFEHFKDAMKYSCKSFKASFFFFIHALIPDIFTQSGSNCVHELSDTIKDKYNKRMTQLNNNN